MGNGGLNIKAVAINLVLAQFESVFFGLLNV
jgi:hypothetical protein